MADYELESEEDEDTLIERRRQKRLAIVAKYSSVNSQVGFVDDHVILVVVIVTSVRCIWYKHIYYKTVTIATVLCKW